MTDIMPIAREAIEEEIDAETKNVEMKVEPKELETVKEEVESSIKAAKKKDIILEKKDFTV